MPNSKAFTAAGRHFPRTVGNQRDMPGIKQWLGKS